MSEFIERLKEFNQEFIESEDVEDMKQILRRDLPSPLPIESQTYLSLKYKSQDENYWFQKLDKLIINKDDCHPDMVLPTRLHDTLIALNTLSYKFSTSEQSNIAFIDSLIRFPLDAMLESMNVTVEYERSQSSVFCLKINNTVMLIGEEGFADEFESNNNAFTDCNFNSKAYDRIPFIFAYRQSRESLNIYIVDCKDTRFYAFESYQLNRVFDRFRLIKTVFNMCSIFAHYWENSF